MKPGHHKALKKEINVCLPPQRSRSCSVEKEDTSDGAEHKRNQKYGANRVERTLIEQWKTGQPWLLLSVL